MVSVASIGSAANKHINPRWFSKFMSAPSVLLRMDDDTAGQTALTQMQQISQAVQCIQVPIGKDVNECYLQAGADAIWTWLSQALIAQA